MSWLQILSLVLVAGFSAGAAFATAELRSALAVAATPQLAEPTGEGGAVAGTRLPTPPLDPAPSQEGARTRG